MQHDCSGVHLCVCLRLRWCRGGALERVRRRQICAATQRTLGKCRRGPQVLLQEERTRGKNRNGSWKSTCDLLPLRWRDESGGEGGWHRLLLSGCINQVHCLQKANDVTLFSTVKKLSIGILLSYCFSFLSDFRQLACFLLSLMITSTSTYSLIYFVLYITHWTVWIILKIKSSHQQDTWLNLEHKTP